MRIMRFCVVMTSVVFVACSLSYYANQKTSKKAQALAEKTSTSHAWKKEFQEKLSEKKPSEWILKQITENLSPFASSGITTEMLDATMQQDPDREQLVRFRIIDNQIAIVKSGSIQSHRLEFITQSLQAICEMAPLPNSDFIISLVNIPHDARSTFPILPFTIEEDAIDLSNAYYYLYLTLLEYARLQK